MSGQSHWPAEPEARRGEKGEKGDPGEGMTRGARHAFLFLAALVAVLAVAALWIGVREVNALSAQLHAQCGADKSIGDLASAPVMLSPATHKASKVGVGIIAANRQAWHGLGCPGRLAAPSPSFRRWAIFYHLPPG